MLSAIGMSTFSRRQWKVCQRVLADVYVCLCECASVCVCACWLVCRDACGCASVGKIYGLGVVVVYQTIKVGRVEHPDD